MIIYSLIKIIYFVAQVFTWLIIIRALLSWFPNVPYNPALKLLFYLTDPLLKPFRKFLPVGAGLDFSPIFAIIAIWLAEQILVGILRMFF